MILTYKYRIKDRCARKVLSRHAYAVNQVWNWCAALQRDIEDRYRSGARKRKWPTHFDLTKQCKGVGFELGIHQQTVQEVCRQFAISRNRVHHAPRFRASFGVRRALGWVPFQQQSRQIEGNSITYLGKTYRFFGNKRRPLPESAKGGAFVEDARGRWYVCFHVEIEAKQPVGNREVGIDLGLKTLATLSDGRKIEHQQVYRHLEPKLMVAQRAGNMQRTRAIYDKIKNRRKDFIHKLTTQLARDYAFIAVGNVNSQQLAKTSMAKSVLDAGWSTLRQQLAYKSASYVDVDEKFTTQTCSCCGSTDSSERPKGIAGLSKRTWECTDCGEIHDRDVNAAKNILIRALSAQRLVGGSRKLSIIDNGIGTTKIRVGFSGRSSYILQPPGPE